jgi:hypothetical protein
MGIEYNEYVKSDPSKWVFEDEKHDQARHMEERMTNGFSVYDWWNFNNYLSWVIIQGLEKFKDGAGHPVNDEINSMDDWRAILDKMIVGFKAMERLMDDFDITTAEEDRALWEEGSALFVKYYPTLWD